MEEEAITQVIIKFSHITDDPQSKMTYTEIITFVVISAIYAYATK